MSTRDQGPRGIRSFTGSTLTAVQPSILKRVYELRDGETPIATMTFKRFVGHEATAVCEEGSWTFRHTGLLKSRLTVEETDSGKMIIEVPVRLMKFMLEFGLPERSHEKLALKRNFFGTEFTLTGRMNRELVTLSTGLLRYSSGSVSLGSRASDYEELPWLVLLVWYFSIVTRRRRSYAN